MPGSPVGLTDRSGTITSGGTAQTLAAQNFGRIYLLIQNVSAGDLWVNFGTTAVANQPSIKLVSGASLEYGASSGAVPMQSVSIIGATTAQAFTAKES